MIDLLRTCLKMQRPYYHFFNPGRVIVSHFGSSVSNHKCFRRMPTMATSSSSKLEWSRFEKVPPRDPRLFFRTKHWGLDKKRSGRRCHGTTWNTEQAKTISSVWIFDESEATNMYECVFVSCMAVRTSAFGNLHQDTRLKESANASRLRVFSPSLLLWLWLLPSMLEPPPPPCL